jgi:hypothetical protein
LTVVGLAIGCSAVSVSPDVPSADASASPTPSRAPSASPEPTTAIEGYTVSEALALRDAAELGSDPIVLVGYWTNRVVPHSCAAPPQPEGEIDVWCHDGESGITEANEAIGRLTNDDRFIPAESAHLTPYVPEAIARVLFGGLMQLEFPPVPIVVRGHFDDPRAADCHETRQQSCRERFVIDEILAFEPLSVPPATPPPTPTPFPSPAPAALFGPEMCAGDVEYAFVGWTTTKELNMGFERPGHVFAMVTKDVIPIGSWIDDPNGSGQQFRWWGQRVCVARDIEIGQPFNQVIMEFDAVHGTGFREWEDGRHEPGDPP